MPPLKGLACVSLLTLAIAAPSAFAQSNNGAAPASGAPTISPSSPSTAPGDQSGQKTHKHRHRSRSTSATGQPGTPATPSQ
jgi:hypothetical protein